MENRATPDFSGKHTVCPSGWSSVCGKIGCCIARPRQPRRPDQGVPASTVLPFASGTRPPGGRPLKFWRLEDEQYGQVRLERWNGLHERRAPELVYDGVRASIPQERSDPPEAIWLCWWPPVSLPPDIPVTAETLLERLRQPVAGRAGHPILPRGPALGAPPISAGRER